MPSQPVLRVRKIRGQIVPCGSCRRHYTCAMYHSFTRHRIRNSEYAQGTNILHNCYIYELDKIPGKIKTSTPHGRTSGIDPT